MGYTTNQEEEIIRYIQKGKDIFHHRNGILIALRSSRARKKSRMCCNRRRGLADEASASMVTKGRSAQNRSYDYYRKKRGGSWWFTRQRNKKKLSADERNVQVAWYSTAIVIGAIGATYASVPLYKVFCQATGFGGTTQRVNFD